MRARSVFLAPLARQLPYSHVRSPLTRDVLEVAMNKHLDEILRTIEVAQKQIAELKQHSVIENADAENFEDAEQGLAWVKKKLQKLKSPAPD